MRRYMVVVAAASLAAIGAAAWRRNRRLGTRFVNTVVNPILLRRLAGSGRSEIGTLEHIGRRSGIRRLTPVHPERTEGGFRIIAPVGTKSEWARNVLAAGHCRLQLHGIVYELDEPRLVNPAEVEGVPSLLRRLESALEFRYLTMRIFAERRGELATGPTEPILEASPLAPPPAVIA